MAKAIQSNKKKPISRGRPPKVDIYLGILKKLGVFHLKDAKKANIPQQTLSRLVAERKILRLAQNLYLHPDSKIDPETEDFVVACAKFGESSAISGLTALFYYRLTDQPPHQIWVVVPPNKHSRDNFYRCLRTNIPLSIGIDQHSSFRIVTLERALAESFRFASKIGLETIIKATRKAFKEKLTTPAKVLKMARELKIERFVMKHWEAITVL